MLQLLAASDLFLLKLFCAVLFAQMRLWRLHAFDEDRITDDAGASNCVATRLRSFFYKTKLTGWLVSYAASCPASDWSFASRPRREEKHRTQ